MSTKKETKTKKTPGNPVPKTQAQAEELMSQIAKADADIRKLTAEMDKKIADIRDLYAPTLDTIKAIMAEGEELLGSWAELNREAFGDKRSLQMVHGVIGWRMGTPAVKLRSRVKEEAAIDRMREELPEYLRQKTEIDKNGILAAYTAKTLTDEQLASVGLLVAQKERFFVEPKREEAQA